MMRILRATKSVFYYTSTASRPSIASFYDSLADEGVIPHGFPHHKSVHTGIGIYNHRTGKVEYVIEGSGDRSGHLVIYENRASTLVKLNNRGQLKSAQLKLIDGFWSKAYDIKKYYVDTDVEMARELLSKFAETYRQQAPVDYSPGTMDCQTVVHYLLRKMTGNKFESPHGEFTLGWGDGLTKPEAPKPLSANAGG